MGEQLHAIESAMSSESGRCEGPVPERAKPRRGEHRGFSDQRGPGEGLVRPEAIGTTLAP
jgi:hypothetical protein